MKKLTKKDKKFRKKVLLILCGTILAYFLIVTIFYKKSKIHYEYVEDGKAYISEHCYERNQYTFCKKDGIYIPVNGYYTTD